MKDNKQDPASLWDVLASMPILENMQAGPRLCAAKVKLSKEANRRHLPHLHRTVQGISQGLRQSIRALVSGESSWPLFLCGPAGTGKTCAVLALLDHVIGSTEYHTASGFCQRLIDAAQGRLEWSHEGRGGKLWPETVWTQITKSALVVIDEIGTREKVSDHAYEVIKRVIDDRHGKPLAVLSNHELDMIAKLYDDRIASRLGAGTVVRLEGEDRRLK